MEETKENIVIFEDDQLRIYTRELRTESLASFTWPCAQVLAAYVLSRRTDLRGMRVLELGCGTALPGLTAALLGAEVLLSDRDGEAASAGAELNNVTARFRPLAWGDFEALAAFPPCDLVLGSDVLYDSSCFDALLATVSELLRRSPPSAVFATTYQHRSGHASLPWRLRRFSLRVKSVHSCKEIEGLSCNVEADVSLVILVYDAEQAEALLA